ncbi:hypothetical protein [Brevibacillus fortis]|uniref:hypothetical protein n=1 Tax=Brevibacillus fortis TaxID=2126352 RepID=UPI0038FC3DFE
MAWELALSDAGPLADSAHIATKGWPVLRTAKSIGNTIDERIRLLDNRTSHLHQVHQPSSLSSVASEMNEMDAENGHPPFVPPS